MYTVNLSHIDIVFCTYMFRLDNRVPGFLDTGMLQHVPSTSYHFISEAPNKALL
jgi:hypothetical protein